MGGIDFLCQMLLLHFSLPLTLLLPISAVFIRRFVVPKLEAVNCTEGSRTGLEYGKEMVFFTRMSGYADLFVKLHGQVRLGYNSLKHMGRKLKGRIPQDVCMIMAYMGMGSLWDGMGWDGWFP